MSLHEQNVRPFRSAVCAMCVWGEPREFSPGRVNRTRQLTARAHTCRQVFRMCVLVARGTPELRQRAHPPSCVAIPLIKRGYSPPHRPTALTARGGIFVLIQSSGRSHGSEHGLRCMHALFSSEASCTLQMHACTASDACAKMLKAQPVRLGGAEAGGGRSEEARSSDRKKSDMSFPMACQ